jgi:ABC-type glutathione transport system ATPase component
MDSVIYEARNLTKHFESRKRTRLGKSITVAVDDVSLVLKEGETLAIVGESGSGKSTLARMLVGLERPTSGAVYLRSAHVAELNGRDLRELRRAVQMVFQDPYASLHPRRRVHSIVSEPWRVHPDIEPRSNWDARVAELLMMVGLSAQVAQKFSTQLSGGERQRVALARTLAMRPEVVVLDEPVSALDVSIQAQVIKLFMELQQQLRLSYVFISHDLPLVRLIADRVMVMSVGRIVEEGSTELVYASPQSEVTRGLLDDV